MLNNSGGGGGFISDVHDLLGDELTVPDPRLDPGAAELNLNDLIGVYESTMLRWELRQDPDQLRLIATNKHAVTGEPDPEPRSVVPAGPNRILVISDGRAPEITGLRHSGTRFVYPGCLLQRMAPPAHV